MYNKIFYLIIVTFFFNLSNDALSQNYDKSSTILFVDSGQSLGDGATFSIALGDIDGDADKDAVIAGHESLNLVWMNNGSGIFTLSQQNIGSGSHGAALGDLDGDADLDLILVYGLSFNKVFFNDGTGHFTDSGQNLGNSDDFSNYVSLADIDSDGDLDALVANYLHPNKIWFNDGNGNFSESSQSIGGNNSNVMAIGDVDSDGDMDIFVYMVDQGDKVMLNDGTGTFIDSGQSLGTFNNGGGNGAGYVALGDLDSDSDLDAFVVNYVNGVTGVPGNKIWLNNGSGIFTENGPYFGDQTHQVHLGDLDGDGDLDAVTDHRELGNYIWVNDGTGTFTSAGPILGIQGGLTISLGDLDGDSDLDAFVGNELGLSNKIYFNETNASAVDENHFVPHTPLLNQNYPNPFNPTTKISYQIPEPRFVLLKVFDVLGNEIATIVNEEKAPGEYEVEFNASKYSSGIYFYKLQTGNYSMIKKMVILK